MLLKHQYVWSQLPQLHQKKQEKKLYKLEHLENQNKEQPEVKNHNIYIACQSNDWVDSSTFIKYLNQICIDNKNTVKPTPEDIVRWVSEIWRSNNITEETINHSFKKGGINLKMMAQKMDYFNGQKLKIKY